MMMCVFGCRWNLVGVMSPVMMTFDRPLYRQTEGAGGGRVEVIRTGQELPVL